MDIVRDMRCAVSILAGGKVHENGSMKQGKVYTRFLSDDLTIPNQTQKA
jgi:hypothetical protein